MTPEESQIEVLIPNLRRYARALTGNVSSADDLVQDCLERALTRLSLWRRGTNLRAWLFTIMRHVWINELSRRAVRPGHSASEDGLEQQSVPPAQMDRLVMRDLAAALALLSDDQREVLLLVGLEGMSYAEVAEVTGLPMGTVMSRLKRGRDRLAQLMQGSETMIRRVK